MSNEGTTKAVFLDKDGTLIEDVPYNVDSRLVRWLPGVMEGLADLHAAGFRLVVISNQSGVALGRFRMEELEMLRLHITNYLAHAQIPLSGFYYCPHHPEGSVSKYAVSCECRKPGSGMLRRAASELNIDLKQSWMIGDILDDVEAGKNCGCRTILLNRGSETKREIHQRRQPDFVAKDFPSAASIVLVNAGHLPQKKEPCDASKSR